MSARSDEAYMVFVLLARGESDTQLWKLYAETPEEQGAMRSRAERVKASWGKCSAPCPLIITGNAGRGE